MLNLPDAFTERMRELLQGEYPAFLESYDAPRSYGLRVNPLRISPEDFTGISPFPLTPIPGLPGCFWIPEDAEASRHPYYAAGLYYLQEPSAMLSAAVCGALPGEVVLDLCAAPGGKATALSGAMESSGLLVANDVSLPRCRVLLRNLELFGAGPLLLTNEQPGRLLETFPGWFDRVLVDAPCSGEGMFRKEEAMAMAWSEEKVCACARLQLEIAMQAARLVRPGGTLVYSTCTFDPRENECILSALLTHCPDLTLEEIPLKHRFPGAADGFSGEYLTRLGYEADPALPLSRSLRLWPHKTRGEGHFVALLRRRGGGEASTRPSEAGQMRSPQTSTNRFSSQKAEGKLVEAFLEECGICFSREELKGIQIRKGQVYLTCDLVPERLPLKFLRNGWYLGEIKKNRFEPAQPLAMLPQAAGSSARVCFSRQDARLLQYLRGESIHLTQADAPCFAAAPFQKGWKLVCVEGYVLGWGKLTGMTLKNHYAPAWRSDGYRLDEASL